MSKKALTRAVILAVIVIILVIVAALFILRPAWLFGEKEATAPAAATPFVTLTPTPAPMPEATAAPTETPAPTPAPTETVAPTEAPTAAPTETAAPTAPAATATPAPTLTPEQRAAVEAALQQKEEGPSAAEDLVGFYLRRMGRQDKNGMEFCLPASFRGKVDYSFLDGIDSVDIVSIATQGQAEMETLFNPAWYAVDDMSRVTYILADYLIHYNAQGAENLGVQEQLIEGQGYWVYRETEGTSGVIIHIGA